MATADVMTGPMMASPDEVPQIQTLNDAISAELGQGRRFCLSDSTGRKLELPPSVFHVLVEVVRALASDQSISIIHYDHELTTQQAADILQVSRPYLIRLLEQGHIPFHMVGTHRRIRMGDLLEYKKRRDNRRKELLKELQRVSEGLGLYDVEDEQGSGE